MGLSNYIRPMLHHTLLQQEYNQFFPSIVYQLFFFLYLFLFYIPFFLIWFCKVPNHLVLSHQLFYTSFLFVVQISLYILVFLEFRNLVSMF